MLDLPAHNPASPAADGPAPPRGRTRTRILDASRELFNASGPGTVTTAEIAAACGISEGNLHYHFRRKGQILLALYDRFEQEMRTHLDRPRHGSDHLAALFALIWEWRCLYDRSVLTVAPEVSARVSSVTEHGQAVTRQRLAEAVWRGELRATPAELEALLVNAWIVASYWIDYLRSHRGLTTLTRAHLDQGRAQVEALFLPYLSPTRA